MSRIVEHGGQLRRLIALAAIIGCALFAGGLSGCVGRAPDRPARPAPPPPLTEIRSGPPTPGMVWAPGYWHWDGVQYVWVPGHWESPPLLGQ